MGDSYSILDTILTERQQEVAGQFHASSVIHALLQKLTEKERIVLTRRFGLSGGEQETLDAIGKSLSLTRERVRQIERGAVKKLRDLSPAPLLLIHADRTLDDTLRLHGGAMEREQLIATILHGSPTSTIERRALLFLLDEIFPNRFLFIDAANAHPGWRLPSMTPSFLERFFAEALAVVDAHGKPMEDTAFLHALRASAWWTEHGATLTETATDALLALSKELKQNAFHAWGRADWETVTPRRMNDKIYLVLEAAAKPLHFTEIATQINAAKFDHKTAYSATVHNELIADDRFVLVGRGLYALKSWGYRPGVVADIIAQILTEAGKPLTREEVVREVLKQRMVSESTIYLSLLQKARFVKTADGKYTLQQQPPPESAAPMTAGNEAQTSSVRQ